MNLFSVPGCVNFCVSCMADECMFRFNSRTLLWQWIVMYLFNLLNLVFNDGLCSLLSTGNFRSAVGERLNLLSVPECVYLWVVCFMHGR